MNELQIVVQQVPGTIEMNFSEVKDALAEKMSLYKDAKFSEEYKVQAKKEVAALRKIRKAIDDKRKEVKEQCMIPYKEFEEKAKELILLIDEPICLIDKQIKVMEERRIAERKVKIEEIYAEFVGDMSEYLSLERIYNKKWENASTTLTSVKKEIEETISSARTSVFAIKTMVSDAVPEALRRYKNDLNLSAALTYINQYEAQKSEILRKEEEQRKKEEEEKRKREEEHIREQERSRIEEENRIRKEEREEVEKELIKEAAGGFFSEDADDDLPFEQPNTITAFYKVVATQEELEQVEMAFNSVGILFERRNA